MIQQQYAISPHWAWSSEPTAICNRTAHGLNCVGYCIPVAVTNLCLYHIIAYILNTVNSRVLKLIHMCQDAHHAGKRSKHWDRSASQEQVWMAFNWLKEQIVFHDTKSIEHTIYLNDVLEVQRLVMRNLRKYPFLMNVEEAMSSSHKKVLVILVSYFFWPILFQSGDWTSTFIFNWGDQIKKMHLRRSKFWKIFLRLACPPPINLSVRPNQSSCFPPLIFASTESIFLLFHLHPFSSLSTGTWSLLSGQPVWAQGSLLINSRKLMTLLLAYSTNQRNDWGQY